MQSIQRIVTATFVSASLIMGGLLVLQPGGAEPRVDEDVTPRAKKDEKAVRPAVDLTVRPPPSPRSAIL